MNGGTLSGGVVIALAAVLWLAYLVPTWLRRRDYLNAERNAVRLQQTLRILAETAEVPEEVRVEATARDVARQQKLLKKARANADAAARAHAQSEARAAARLAAEREAEREAQAQARATARDAMQARTGSGTVASATRLQRERTFTHAVRRSRLVTFGAVVASLIGLCFGAYAAATAGSWWVFLASAALLVCAIAVLRRLALQVAAHRAARPARVATVRAEPELFDHSLEVATESRSVPATVTWEPQPLPKPMYQSPGSRAAAAMASLDAAVALRRAAARAELEARAAKIAEASVPTLPKREAPAAHVEAPETDSTAALSTAVENTAVESAAPSRFARMGVLDGVESEHLDLDEALRRRRVG